MTKNMLERMPPEKWYDRAVHKTPNWSPLNEDTPPLDLALPHGAKLCATGVVLPERLEFDEWLAIGKKLIEIDKGMQWALGEWWAFGRHKYGARASAAKKLPYAFGTLANHGWVARSVPTSSRNEALDWSHHKAVAKLGETDQQYWLEKAVEEEWSAKTLEQKIRKKDNTDRADADQKLKQEDPECFRKAQSQKIAADAIYLFGKISNAHFDRCVQVITTDPQLRADLDNRMLARLTNEASSMADVFNEVVRVLKEEQERRATKANVAIKPNEVEAEPATKLKKKRKRERLEAKAA